MGIGFDCGTYNLVCCKRDANKDFLITREVNAFLEFPVEDRAVLNMMQSNGVRLIERRDAGVAYALGEGATSLAYAFGAELKRPMKDGCLNPHERNAQQLLASMIHGMLGNVEDNEPLYYCVPANAINEETDADYHGKILESIFRDFEDENGHVVKAHPINEGLALVYAELGHKMSTGLGVSCGAGMVNVCFAKFGSPVFAFSLVNSGDWIDAHAAKATGEAAAYINKEKTKIDLTKEPETLVQRAIKAQYEIMIQKTVSGIKKGLESTNYKIRADENIDIVIAGGTSSPTGFENLVADYVEKAKLPIQIGSIVKPKDPLYSVSRGCLLAAEASEVG